MDEFKVRCDDLVKPQLVLYKNPVPALAKANINPFRSKSTPPLQN